jgi:hypothetical protein
MRQESDILAITDADLQQRAVTQMTQVAQNLVSRPWQPAKRLEEQLLPGTKTRPAIAVVEGRGDAIVARQFTLRDEQAIADGVSTAAMVADGAQIVRSREP